MINVGFDFDDLFDHIEEFENKVVDTFCKAGEVYVAGSRERGNYQDRTGNLRNANSYKVSKKGVTIEKPQMMPETAAILDADPAEGHIVLVAGNGMDYASYVEGKGYDVVSSGQLEVGRFIEDEMRKLENEPSK